MLEEIVELVYRTKDIVINEQKKFEVSDKGKNDYVTNVDLAVSRYLQEELYKLYPEYSFMDEENNNKNIDFSKPTWILDPIDGTTNLVRGYNYSAVSLGLVVDKKPVLGVVYNPFTEEMYSGEISKGAFLNGKPIKVSDTENMEDSVVLFGTSPYQRDDADETFKYIKNVFLNCREVRRFGAASIDLCYVADRTSRSIL